jgi:hypothetical protein
MNIRNIILFLLKRKMYNVEYCSVILISGSMLWKGATIFQPIQGVPGGISRLRESVSYVKVYRYNTKHLYPKLNGYKDNV